jgi:chitin disaccharide deacetylase
MKSLIVNGDDFGAGKGINRGVIEAHERGILTSTSLMVDAAASAEAARLAGRHPALGMGLHVDLRPAVDPRGLEHEIERQLTRFVELTGRQPTHLDSHHYAHRDPELLQAFLAVAERHSLPLRDHCEVRHISTFYARSNGQPQLERVGPDALAQILTTEVEDGFNELCCHPAYVDEELASSYTFERQAELETLCDPAVAALVRATDIRLVTFSQVPIG